MPGAIHSFPEYGLMFFGSFVLKGARAIHAFSYGVRFSGSLVYKDAWRDSLISIWFEVLWQLSF